MEKMRRKMPMMSERWLWDRFLYQIRVSGMIPEGGKILDVGTGINTTTLEMFGDKWDVTPSDVNVGEWNSHIPGMMPVDVREIGQQFDADWDVIILSEVLEHIPFPEHMGVLEGILYALKPEGLLILSVPFMSTEPGLKDYGRLTPNGLIDYFNRTQFIEFWVGSLVKNDAKTFPEKDCPEGVVAWAKKQKANAPGMFQTQILEDGWNPSVPVDWRERQQYMARKYTEQIERKEEEIGREVESV
jgi:SAM-dependent methyltransferase